MGESVGQDIVGNDDAVFPYITSCNVACGFHGGDEKHMQRTVASALARGIRIGAHPSYPDRAGFGRIEMQLPSDKLREIIRHQIITLKKIVERQGGKLEYVKPHGALYNTIAIDSSEAWTVYGTIREIDPSLSVMGLAGSIAQAAANELGIAFISEAFADRAYEADGTLMSRSKVGAVYSDPDKAVAQVISIILNQRVVAGNGTLVQLQADSICIHGDNPAAVEILSKLDEALKINHILKACERI